MSNLDAAVRLTEPARDTATASGRLNLRGLTKQFAGGVVAVDDVDLEIAPGEFVTLLGPSGCGKTTTLRMIAGFESPTSGAVDLDGVPMISVPPSKRPMAMVFQSYALFPHMSVRDNVAYGLRLRRTPAAQLKEDVELALTSMNLLTMADRAPSQLSGGQQQRVALARAMVMRPNVLLFDEPLSNLDAKLRELMRLEIRRLQHRLGITSVYVTHDQAEAMAMSDRVVVMNSGRIEQAAAPDVIYRRPASVFVADFIGRANFLSADVLGAAGPGEARVEVFGEELVVPAHPAALAEREAVLLVRPESVRVRPVGAPGTADNADPQGRRGRVLATVFYGEHVEYEIETEHGTVLAVVSDPEVADIPSEGEIVEVSFAPSRAWLLPRR
ncbi:ABC transporter related protein [Xylanimonas cellulosilytica DSM 15894]|uniref:ABC transporter related protein n=2 Tax=Xylanimonas TaxID=186188 RepID=D1BZA4_XYLCX|nr:ABC transporter related protein [Xylanimonas cellulosilytica DSM 15894]